MSHHPERTARNVRPVNQPPSFIYHLIAPFSTIGNNFFSLGDHNSSSASPNPSEIISSCCNSNCTNSSSLITRNCPSGIKAISRRLQSLIQTPPPSHSCTFPLFHFSHAPTVVSAVDDRRKRNRRSSSAQSPTTASGLANGGAVSADVTSANIVGYTTIFREDGRA